MIATSDFLTALECTKFVFGRGSAPDTAGGDNSALIDLDDEGKWREREGPPPLMQIPGSAPVDPS